MHNELTEKQIAELYAAQERLYYIVINMLKNARASDILLVGGTPLARCLLHHRISFDLDFVVNPSSESIFTCIDVCNEAPNINCIYKNISDDVYRSVFYEAIIDDICVKFSFIEDRKFGLMQHTHAIMGSTNIDTITIDSHYHNKIRTVMGDFKNGGRTQIRDIFDLVVLNNKYMPIEEYFKKLHSIDNSLYYDDFLKAAGEYEWLNVVGQKILPLGEWYKYRDIGLLQEDFYKLLGFDPPKDEYWLQMR